MSQTLTIELSDTTYKEIERRARQVGELPARIAVSMLEQQLEDSGSVATPATEAEKQAARQSFEHLIGSVDLGYPISSENEDIDADLAREYGDAHESA